MLYPKYKVVEVDNVTAEQLEQKINEVLAEGWELDAIQFVTPNDHRRPTLAFLFFTQGGEAEDFDDDNNHDHNTN